MVDKLFDFDKDGKLSSFEQAVQFSAFMDSILPENETASPDTEDPFLTENDGIPEADGQDPDLFDL